MKRKWTRTTDTTKATAENQRKAEEFIRGELWEVFIKLLKLEESGQIKLSYRKIAHVLDLSKIKTRQGNSEWSKSSAGNYWNIFLGLHNH